MESNGGGRDFDVREIFGISATCPICLDDCTEVVALPCGHVLCKADYQRMGGSVEQCCLNNDSTNNVDDDEHNADRIIIRVKDAGQHGVNRTYTRHHDDRNRYISMGRYDGEDVEYFIEMRVENKKIWYLGCQTGNPNEAPVDFYRAQVNERCAYPTRVRWESATIAGTFPSPKSDQYYFGHNTDDHV